MRWAGRAHPGHVRSRNEDVWGVRPEARVAAVADGVGGAPGGDRAALIAVDRTLNALVAEPWPDSDGTVRRVAVHGAHDEVCRSAEDDPGLRGMATTLTAVRWRGRRVEGVHVGDCRAYLVQDDEITPLTRDHTPAGEALERGEITREGLREHPRGNMILRAVGGVDTPPEVDLFEVDPFPEGAAILLCSDGIEAALPEGRVSELTLPVLADRDPDVALDRLFQAALAGSAPDNLSAVLLLDEGGR